MSCMEFPGPSFISLSSNILDRNSHFQTTLGVTKAQGAGLSGAYFGAYFLGPLTYSGWILSEPSNSSGVKSAPYAITVS